MLNLKSTGKCAGAIVVAAVMTAQHASAEILWKIETTSSDNAAPEVTEIWANAANLRMSVTGGDAGEAIYLGERNEIVMIDHDKKQYMVMQAGAVSKKMDEMRPQMDAAMAAMKEAMADMDPQSRAMAMAAMKSAGGPMASMMNPDAAPKISVAKTKEKQTILGARAVKYEVSGGATPVQNVWAVKVSDVEGGAIVRDRMDDLMSFFETAMGDSAPIQGNLFRLMGDLDGRVPVGGENLINGKVSTSRLTSAADVDAPADIWSPPAGYEKMAAPF